MNLIGKNTKKMQKVLAQAKEVREFSVANAFAGEELPAECTSPANWKEKVGPQRFLKLLISTYRSAMLYQIGEREFRITLNRNHYYTFNI